MSVKKNKLARVALCGKRNVGKSTLFNTLLGKKRAITDEIAGLTRDILEAQVKKNSYNFILFDTPGLDVENPDEIESIAINKAIENIKTADLILLMLDGKNLESYDLQLVDIVRKTGKPVLFVVNKIDNPDQSDKKILPFLEIGLQNPIPISAAGRWNIDNLLKKIGDILPDAKAKNVDFSDEAGNKYGNGLKKDDSTVISDMNQDDIRLAIVGKPNAGKSSLLNALIDKEISIVSDVPGTTRDTIDEVITYHSKKIRIIDTAGLRKSSFFKKKNRTIDFYSMARAKRAIKDSDVTVHLIDAQEGISEFDKKISALINENHKPVIFAINKWDSMEDKDSKSTRDYLKKLYFDFPLAKNYPVIFCSAKTKQRIDLILKNCVQLFEKMKFKITTGELNKLIAQWNDKLRDFGSSSRVYYATQADGIPPAFIFFVSNKKQFKANYLKFFENQIREKFSLSGIPVIFILKEKSKK